jgi:PAS domain S-box-containing protein
LCQFQATFTLVNNPENNHILFFYYFCRSIKSLVYPLLMKEIKDSIQIPIRQNKSLRKEIKTANEKLFRAMFNSHKAIMLLIEPHSGFIVDANAAAVKFYKYSKKELRKLRIQDINILPPEEVEAERLKALNQEKHFFTFPHKLANGQIRWVEVYSSSFVFQSKPLLYSIIHDVTEKKQAELAQQKSEEKFESAFKSNPNAIILSNMEDGKIFEVNDSFSELTGLSQKYVVGKSTLEIGMYVSNTDREKIIRLLKKQGYVRNQEIVIRHKSGNERIVLFSSEILKTSAGKTILSTLQDITKRKQLENQQKSQAALFQTIIDTVPVMISIYNPDLQNIQLNKEFERVTGWSKRDFSKYSTVELVYPDPEYRQEVADYMLSLKPGFKEIIMTGKDGSKIESLWSNVALDDGRHVGVGIDIRERKKAENEREQLIEQLAREKEALAESEQRYRIMGEAIDYGVWAADAAGKVTYISESFCRLVGKPAKEFLEDGWHENLIIEQSHEVMELWMHSVRTGEPFEDEHHIISSEGELKIILAKGKPIRNALGQIISWAGIHFDITERKKIQEQLQKQNSHLVRINEVLSDFVQIAGHDLRSPIANLISISDLISRQPDTDKKTELFNMLKPVIKRLQLTVEGLLEMVTLQVEEQVNAEVIKFYEVWKEVQEVLSAEIKNFKGEIEIDFGDSPEIKYVKIHLISILRNLVSNAIKYSADAENPHVKIFTTREKGYVLLLVRDNGMGMDLKKVKKNLFKPFRRFTTKAEGTGMGLYIVKNIIEKNGGKIHIESRINEGTAFYCFLKEYKP